MLASYRKDRQIVCFISYWLLSCHLWCAVRIDWEERGELRRDDFLSFLLSLTPSGRNVTSPQHSSALKSKLAAKRVLKYWAFTRKKYAYWQALRLFRLTLLMWLASWGRKNLFFQSISFKNLELLSFIFVHCNHSVAAQHEFLTSCTFDRHRLCA